MGHFAPAHTPHKLATSLQDRRMLQVSDCSKTTYIFISRYSSNNFTTILASNIFDCLLLANEFR